ncbi:MAG: TRAP transporter substrate-binding protein [Roseococcus sp.]|nr:TRAP transporter substrate-binding protein [Roseococcus sp.]
MSRLFALILCLPPFRGRRKLATLTLILGGLAFLPGMATAQARPEGISLKIIGGLANVSQYNRHEAPFWLEHIPRLTQGQVRAEIAPFDRSGIRGSDMLHLMRLGVVPFGTLILSIAGADEPELTGSDLAGLNPDMAHLRRHVGAFRPVFTRVLRDRYDIEVLAVYTYPAQVLFCNRTFTGLSDIAGRRVRASSVAQADMVEALGGTPVVIPFAAIVSEIRRGTVECAITAALSGNAIGLHEATTHLHAMAFSWGISVFGVHRPSWELLPETVRAPIRAGLAELEAQIWTAAEQETTEGLACNAGQGACNSGRRGTMRLIPVSAADEARRRQVLRDTVLPRWIARCGEECAAAWNAQMAEAVGIRAEDMPR